MPYAIGHGLSETKWQFLTGCVAGAAVERSQYCITELLPWQASFAETGPWVRSPRAGSRGRVLTGHSC